LKSSYPAKDNSEVNKQKTQVGTQKEFEAKGEEKKQDWHGTEEKDDLKARKAPKQGTFKRLNRPKGKPQHEKQQTEVDSKKRSVDLMEIEIDIGAAKKAKMETDAEEEKEQTTKSEDVNAGLHGQPGGSK
jgi:hypothetical protein